MNAKIWIVASTAALALAACTAPVEDSTPSTEQSLTEIRGKIDDYIAVIDNGDMALAEQTWATTPEVSFIHPRGESHGWDAIRTEFYQDTMLANFSKRALHVDGEPTIAIYGDSAVVTFHWIFDATRSADGQEVQTRGRETQVLEKLPGQGWRIIHVHYSGPPVSAAGQGF